MLVDGAHAVGSRALAVPDLGAHYYTANLHKWACTPKGSALLWVEREQQQRVTPLTTSHGYGLVWLSSCYEGPSVLHAPSAWHAE